MAHPIRPESYIAMDNFYTVTVYNKGAEVIRMYRTLLGEDGFRKGMDLYFDRHDGQVRPAFQPLWPLVEAYRAKHDGQVGAPVRLDGHVHVGGDKRYGGQEGNASLNSTRTTSRRPAVPAGHLLRCSLALSRGRLFLPPLFPHIACLPARLDL
jgi:hypothetical protein